MGTRRSFLTQLGLAAGSFPLLPALSPAERLSLGLHSDDAEEAEWESVRRQFAMPADRIMVNAANLCPAPRTVYEKVNAELSGLSADVSFQYRQRFAESRQKALEALAGFLGVARQEVGITRNTSEANCIIVNGLDLKPGDEVVIWDQNHPSCNEAWVQRAKRMEFTVKKVSVTPQPETIEELMAPFQKSVTAKTKLLAFSHVSNSSGMALPAKEICVWARNRGILTLVDGAQSFGMMELNLAEMGCDFYTASTHKWLMGPMENGVIYVRGEVIPRVWPQAMGAGWKESTSTVDERLCTLGQRNDTATIALGDAFEFQARVGRKNIQNRVVELNRHLASEVVKRIPSVEFVSPRNNLFSAGITIVSIPGKNMQEVYQQLYMRHGVACAATGGLRFSPHIYNTRAEIEKVAEGLASL